jgi:CRP-like cAMP-binding protein
LGSLAPRDRARLERHLEPIDLKAGRPIETVEQPISHVYFPLSGLVSIVAHAGEYDLEVGIIGRDGMTGTTIVLGSEIALYECFVQIAGEAMRISTADFRRVVADTPSLMAPLLAYVRTLFRQIAQTAVANGHCTTEERLSRWLLMSQDRLGGDAVALTHELISTTLGVHRPAITTALQVLEKSDAIALSRSLIRIRDRRKLKDFAGGVYRGPK